MDSSGQNSTSNSTPSTRGKTDPAWEHVTEGRAHDGKKTFTCLYCGKTIKGGGINRMKQHLAGKLGEVGPCKKVPADVRFRMEECLKSISENKRQSKETYEQSIPYGPGKQAVHKAHMIAAKFFYDACIPLNAVNSVYFQPMFDAAIAIGAGYKVPTYHQFRVPLLQDSKKELELFIATLRTTWADTGCTIMGDGWSDRRHRTLINFLVYCPRGITFVKSVDASDAVKDAQLLFKLFQEIIEWVGVSNVVHMVTDNGANYVAAGRLINETYKTINWSPCAAHCLNLILGEISKMTHIHDLAIRASKVTRYVYNRPWLVAWLRKRKGWTEIVRPGATRFATTFIALHSTHKHMHDLKALVTSKEFVDSRYAKEKKSKEIIAIILDNKFWNDCLVIVKIVEPLMRLLRIVDGDVKPSMGYVYEGIYRARTGIKQVFLNKRRLYKPYTDILKQRWDNQLRKNIHAAAYWLNPAFQYDQASFCRKPEVMSSFLDLVDTKATCSKTKLLDESRLYRDRLESFGRELALTTCKTTQPDEWWRLFGHSAPNLQKLAIRILSQTSSSSGCERNWNVFERIHTKKRNRLEHQRLNDLVFVHYNLRLQNRHLYKMKNNYDPVDIESIDKTEFWIVEEEEDPPLLDYDELEQMLNEDGSTPQSKRQCNRPQDDGDDDAILEIGDHVDLECFGNTNISDEQNAQDGRDGNGNNEDEDDWLTRGLPRN
ncbi:uncharacterized protein LOC130786623 [Actinidia eriantha]|uniref:uncharacterized protein LOC130786623 n=1 Tax=Actinidia eriantha TaxID=165200 RepID=UPI00258EB0C5|nr:uncharacterized protein LOC130786623 [Actinidia eriantha]